MVYRLDFAYGVDSQEARVICMNGATSSCAGGVLTATCGTNSYSGAGMQGRFPLVPVDRSEVGCEFTAMFDPNAAPNTLQVVGVGDGEHGVFVGYNGTRFGVRLLTGGQVQYYYLQVAAAAARAGTLTVTLNGAVFSYSLTAGQSVAAILAQVAYDPALLGSNMQAWVQNGLVVISTALAMPTVVAPIVSDGNTGCSPSITQPLAGAAPVDQWAYPSSGNVVRGPFDWNGIGLDPSVPVAWSNANTFKISFSPLGFGSIRVSMINPNTLDYTPLHTFNNSNSTQNLSCFTLGLLPSMYAVNFTGGQSLNVKTTGFMISASDGLPRHRVRPAFTAGVAAASAPLQAAPYTLLTLQNLLVYNSVRNCKVACLRKLAFSLATSAVAQLSLYKDPCFTAVLKGVQKDPNSCVLVDSTSNAPLAPDTGALLKTWILTASAPFFEVCVDDVWAEPGSVLVFTVAAPNAQAAAGAATVVGSTTSTFTATAGLTVTWVQA